MFVNVYCIIIEIAIFCIYIQKFNVEIVNEVRKKFGDSWAVAKYEFNGHHLAAFPLEMVS